MDGSWWMDRCMPLQGMLSPMHAFSDGYVYSHIYNIFILGNSRMYIIYIYDRCISMYTYIWTYVYIYMYSIYIYVSVYIYMYIYIHTIHMYIYIYTQLYTYICTHMWTHGLNAPILLFRLPLWSQTRPVCPLCEKQKLRFSKVTGTESSL